MPIIRRIPFEPKKVFEFHPDVKPNERETLAKKLKLTDNSDFSLGFAYLELAEHYSNNPELSIHYVKPAFYHLLEAEQYMQAFSIANKWRGIDESTRIELVNILKKWLNKDFVKRKKDIELAQTKAPHDIMRQVNNALIVYEYLEQYMLAGTFAHNLDILQEHVTYFSELRRKLKRE